MMRALRLVCLALALLGLGSSVAGAQSTDPRAVVGEWGPLLSFQVAATHAHLLPTDRVLYWPTSDSERLWDPATNAVTTPANKANYNVFCSGHCFLPDGRLLVAGGHRQNNFGLPYATTLNPLTGLWTRVPNMNKGRWYPTNTALAPIGDVLVVSGDVSKRERNTLPQVYQWQLNAWRNLTGAVLAQELYPWMHMAPMAPDGRVFHSGASITTRYLDVTANDGAGRWETVGDHVVRRFRSYGTSVMYDVGKILVVGGAQDPPEKTAEVIDLNEATPAWRPAGFMARPRRQLNATVLPDGTVLVTGGTSGGGFNSTSEADAVKDAELWDPAKWDPADPTSPASWKILAAEQRKRLYHSTALLLPDARVLSAGGDNEANGQLFSPPYLFWGSRPAITSAPASVSYGETFFVDTPDALSVTRVTWLPLASVTHAFNQNQWFNELSFVKESGRLGVTAPASRSHAPPGYYMLFILTSDPSGLGRGWIPAEKAAVISLG